MLQGSFLTYRHCVQRDIQGVAPLGSNEPRHALDECGNENPSTNPAVTAVRKAPTLARVLTGIYSVLQCELAEQYILQLRDDRQRDKGRRKV